MPHRIKPAALHVRRARTGWLSASNADHLSNCRSERAACPRNGGARAAGTLFLMLAVFVCLLGLIVAARTDARTGSKGRAGSRSPSAPQSEQPPAFAREVIS
ncbi:MAG: hypothetical protein NDI75_14395 [Candidatus Didemnitutus sp.]|jgi:hypothetical protein|nr:hypothetical protein [Candidatus Didemnitutus sp.]